MGPVLMMEYLDNGDLAQLYYRTIKYGFVVPNRAPWSILLCRKFSARSCFPCRRINRHHFEFVLLIDDVDDDSRACLHRHGISWGS